MSKKGLALISLVAAIPGAYLAYHMVMTWLNRAGGPTTMFQVLAGLTLAMSALMAVFPLVILIAGPKGDASSAKAKEKKKKDKKKEGEEDVDEADVLAAEDAETAADEGDEIETAAASDDLSEYEVDEADVFLEDADAAGDFIADAEVDEVDEVEFDDFEDEKQT